MIMYSLTSAKQRIPKMFRNILRTSRYLTRRRINNFIPTASAVRLNSFTKFISPNSFSFANYSSKSTEEIVTIEPVVFEEICSETLESLCDYFEELIEEAPNLKGADVVYSDGVLTVFLGTHGTYVINRQSPNKQIWLSSPVSGPKRYDLILKNGGYWAYKHDGVSLHKLLQEELSKIVNTKVEFNKCAHSLL